MRNKNKKSANKIASILALAGISAVILMVSTYAWFIGLQEVLVNEFQVKIASTDNLLISLNAEMFDTAVTLTNGNWKDYVDGDAGATASDSYVGNTNSWGGTGLAPVSTVGDIDLTSSTLQLFQRSSYTAAVSGQASGFRLMASRMDNHSAGYGSAEQDGYVAFDLFIKNTGGAEYLTTYDPTAEEKLYLLTDSVVAVNVAGADDEAVAAIAGIENSVRVAFAQIGRVSAGTETPGLITGIACGDVIGADDSATEGNVDGVTGICEDAVIWEPNDMKHADVAVDWHTRYCRTRSANDAEGNVVYTATSCQVSSDGALVDFDNTADLYVDTWAVNAPIVSSDLHDFYDGHNTFTPIAKVTNVDTFTDTEKMIAGQDRPEFMTLAPNSITKIRVYVYLEGNDIDNIELAAAGHQINVNFGFTKQPLTEADFTP